MRRVYSPLMNSDILITRERNSLFGRKAENRQKKSLKKTGIVSNLTFCRELRRLDGQQTDKQTDRFSVKCYVRLFKP